MFRDDWDDAGRTNRRQAFIHPTGVDAAAYAESGRVAAAEIAALMFGQGLTDPVVLDFGCGDGRVAGPLSDMGFRVVGADASAAMLDALAVNAPSVEPLLYRGPLRWPVADAAYSHAVWIHATYDEGVEMLADLRTMVRFAHRAYVQIPVYDTRREPEHFCDVGTWTLPDLEAACAATGWRLITAYPNPGPFAYDRIGPNHGALHVLENRR